MRSSTMMSGHSWLMRSRAPSTRSRVTPSYARPPKNATCAARKSRSSSTNSILGLFAIQVTPSQRLGFGQFHSERGAAPRIRIEPDPPAMHLDDAVGDGQAKSGSASKALGGEEGVKTLVAPLARDAAAFVADRHAHATSCRLVHSH